MRSRHSSAILVVLMLLATSARSASTARTRQFLIASDLHFNPFADPTLAADLAAVPASPWDHSTPGRWMREYTFTEEWHAQQLDAGTLKSIYDRIRTDSTGSDRWLTLVNVSSAHEVIPAGGVGNLDCAIAGLDPASYQACYCPIPVPRP